MGVVTSTGEVPGCNLLNSKAKLFLLKNASKDISQEPVFVSYVLGCCRNVAMQQHGEEHPTESICKYKLLGPMKQPTTKR